MVTQVLPDATAVNRSPAMVASGASHAPAPYRRGRTLPALLAVAALLAGALIGRLAGDVLGEGDVLRPSLPAVMSREPLGRPAEAPSGNGGFVLLHEQPTADGKGTQPVRWDPCRPVTYVIRPDGAPPGGPAALDWAIGRIESLTGLAFVFVGASDEGPGPHRPAMDQARYGDRWSPVLIAWTDPTEYAPMAGFAGLGGPASIEGRHPAERRYVSGSVLLNRAHLREVESWPRGRQRERAVILHELSHLVGLDHVDDPAALMSRRPGVAAFDFSAGDLRGLAAVSGGPCFADS